MQFDFQVLGKGKCTKRNEAVVVPFVARSLGEWRPDEGECHRNCDWWALHNPGCEAVRGWLLFGFGMFGFIRFNPHSVIKEEDGTLIDITPSKASQRYPFIRHWGLMMNLSGWS